MVSTADPYNKEKFDTFDKYKIKRACAAFYQKGAKSIDTAGGDDPATNNPMLM